MFSVWVKKRVNLINRYLPVSSAHNLGQGQFCILTNDMLYTVIRLEDRKICVVVINLHNLFQLKNKWKLDFDLEKRLMVHSYWTGWTFRMNNVCWVIVWNVSPLAKFLFLVDEDELFLEGQRQSNIVGPKLKHQALTVCKLYCKHITYVHIVLNASSLLCNVTLVYELSLFWCIVFTIICFS